MSGESHGDDGEIKALAADDEAPPEIQRFLSPPPPPPDGAPQSTRGSQPPARRRSRRPVRGQAEGLPPAPPRPSSEASPDGAASPSVQVPSNAPARVPDPVPAASRETRDSRESEPPKARRAFPSNPDGSLRTGPVIPPAPPVPTMPARVAPTLRTVPRPRTATIDGKLDGKRRGSEPAIEVVSTAPPASPTAEVTDDNARTLERAPVATLPDASTSAETAPEYEVIRPMRIISIGTADVSGNPEGDLARSASPDVPEPVAALAPPAPSSITLPPAALPPGVGMGVLAKPSKPPPPQIADREAGGDAPPVVSKPSKPPVPSGPLPPLVPPEGAKFPPTPPVVEIDPDDEEDDDWGPSRAPKAPPVSKPPPAPPPARKADRSSAPSDIEIDPFASDDEHERISDLEIAAHAEAQELADLTDLSVHDAEEVQPAPKKPPPPPKRLATSDPDMSASLDAGLAKSPPPSPTTGGPPPPPPAAPAAPASTTAAPPRVADPSVTKRQKPWWEEIFSDDYIRTMEKLEPKAVRKECDFIEDRLGLEKGAIMLDLACGAGAHAVELAQRGYNVVGYDLSLAMLALAQDEAQERGQKINFLQGDMREMAFEEAFDGIYSWSTSFGYFDDEKNLSVLSRVHRALRQGGMFLLDVANRDYVCARQPSLVWFEGDDCVSMDEMFVDFFTSRLRVKRTVLFEDGRSRECDYGIRLYGLHELGKMLHETGFKVVEVTGHPAHPGVFFGSESPRIIILAERA